MTQRFTENPFTQIRMDGNRYATGTGPEINPCDPRDRDGYILYWSPDKNEPIWIPTSQLLSGFAPVFVSITPALSNANLTGVVLTVSGYNFNATTTVNLLATGLGDLVVNSTTFVDPNTITINVDTGIVDDFYDLEISDPVTGTILVPAAYEVRTINWVDLRLGGEPDPSLNVVTSASITAVTRDAQGMFFTGPNSWNNFAQIQGFQYPRSANSTLEWIWTTNLGSTFMIGVGGDMINVASNQQYYQQEVLCYVTGTTHWGWFGNSGVPGAFWNLGNTGVVSNTLYYKSRFVMNGTTGNTLETIQVNGPNIPDWDIDVATVATIVSTNVADEPNLWPVIVPFNANTNWRAVAFRIL